MSHNKIKHAIKNYAKAYQALQYWQDNHPAIPGGDQKTGSIGEYYAYLYLSFTEHKNIQKLKRIPSLKDIIN